MVEKIVIYKDFYRAGTTALLRNIFNNPSEYQISPVFISVNDKDVDAFEFVLNNSKVRNHKQMKINVDLALIATIQGEEHFFIISESSNMIVDLTTNLNYNLKSDKLQGKIRDFLEKYG